MRTGPWSEGVEREAVWLSGVVSSFELAEEVLMRMRGVAISRSSIWRCTQEVGANFRVVERAARERATMLPRKWEPPSREIVADQRMGVSLDGLTMNVRTEGWKEVKIGSIFDISVYPCADTKSGEFVDLAHAVNNSYVAHLGGPEVVGEMAWAEAQRRGWEQAQDTAAVGDGAPWIWNLAALHFGESHQIVDWYHAKEHLIEAGRLLKGDNNLAFRRWLNSRETRLYQGHAEQIAIELDKAANKKQVKHRDDLLREAAYFRHNQLRMNYLEMREQAWPIGSGMIESAAKQFKARFGGPGMRWSRTGAVNLLPIRAAVLSKRFDEMWQAARNLPPS